MIITEYAGICVNISKSAWLTSVLYLSIVNPLSKRTIDCFLEK